MKKVHRVISFNQDEWLKSYIENNAKLRTEAKNEFEKDFFKLMNNVVFGKTMENMRKHRDLKLVTIERKTNFLLSHPKYYTTKFFTKSLLAIEVKKAKITMNKPDYFDFLVSEWSKTAMYDFWYNYIKPKYGKKAKPFFIDTNSFIVHIKTKVIYKDIAEDVETRFDTSNYDIDKSLRIGKNKQVIGLMEDELGRKIMKEFVRLCPKPSYLKDNNDDSKKAIGRKSCVIKKP